MGLFWDRPIKKDAATLAIQKPWIVLPMKPENWLGRANTMY